MSSRYDSVDKGSKRSVVQQFANTLNGAAAVAAAKFVFFQSLDLTFLREVTAGIEDLIDLCSAVRAMIA